MKMVMTRGVGESDEDGDDERSWRE
jgi:hypothetical protein